MSRIQLEHLNFTYEGSHTPVFEDLNLSIDTGWKLGLVGRNGRGKTTLLLRKRKAGGWSANCLCLALMRKSWSAGFQR